MTKVSSNAGKHPYRRTDEEYVHLFDHMRINKPGFRLTDVRSTIKQKIATEHTDKKGKRLFFQDIIIYEKEEYVVDYNAKEFYWIAINPRKTFKLSQIATKTIYAKKNNKA